MADQLEMDNRLVQAAFFVRLLKKSLPRINSSGIVKLSRGLPDKAVRIRAVATRVLSTFTIWLRALAVTCRA